jgi:prepilin-type N-terminal cleavage/methylation domain-containing protein
MKHTNPLFVEAPRGESIAKNFLHNRRISEGFTVIEILVVVTISAILSAVVIGYSTVSRNDVAVSVETAKIYQTIFQAKTLAIATYANSSSSCGYGVSFNYNAGTYSIFTYDPSGAPPCPDSATVASNNITPSEMVPYSQSTWKMSVARGVALKQKGDSVAFVLFYPPNPTTFISRDGTSFTDISEPSSNIYLAPIGNASATEVISVNSVGQITTL